MFTHIKTAAQRLLFLSLTFILLGGGAWGQDISVQLDGRNLTFDQPPAMIDGRLLVPLRGIFEALSADVLYDAATRSIKATKGTTVVQLQLGSRTALIDGRTVYLDVPADTVGGRTMVPLRFVSESLGAEVKWNGATRLVELKSGSGNSSDSKAVEQNPANPSSSEKPNIDEVTHSATSTLSPGDSLEVVVSGDPGASASFEILGKTQEVNIPETSPGHYQTRWTVPNGLQVQKGVLLVHLRRNNLESIKEATRKISVQPASSSTSNGSSSSGWQTTPADGSTTNSVRPQLTAIFPLAVIAGTPRLYVDGLDFSQQISLSGNRVSWSPSYDLTSGTHSVQLRASATSGQQLDYRWSFNVDPTSSVSLALQQLRPAEGELVYNTRPVIEALFNQNVRSATLAIDNVDVTNQSGISRLANGISWVPSYNLSSGTHRATATARDANNRQVSRTWSFTISTSSATNPNGLNQIFAVTNLANGATVSADFMLSGTAEPGRQITIVTEYSPNNIIEAITGQVRRITQSVLTSSSGRFTVKLNTSPIASGQSFRLTVSDGGNSSNLVYNLRKR